MELFKLGANSIEYIKEELLQGLNLAKTIPRSIDLKKGETLTFLPSDSSLESIESFAVGGISNLSNGLESLASFLLKIINDNDSLYLILEEELGRLDYSWIKDEGYQFFTCGEEIYYFLSGKAANLADMLRLIRRASSYPWIGFLMALPKSLPNISHRDDFSRDVLEVLAKNVEIVFVGAYDHEGFLIWKRSFI